MKTNTLFSRMNLVFGTALLALAMAGALFLSGCASADSGGSGPASQPSHQHHH